MKRAIAAGVGLLVVALAVVAGIIGVRGGFGGYKARVILADAGGLQNGSTVIVNGVSVGRVTSLQLDSHDRAVAEILLSSSAAPLGRGAHATVQIDDFFGERALTLTRGDYERAPEPSGYTIPVRDSGVSVRLDDIVNTLDMSAQGALRTFLAEQGTALVGRGHDLAAVMAELPQSLPSLTNLMSQLSSNQQALGSLVDHSDRVVAEIAAQRDSLGELVHSAGRALAVLASRRPQLGATVQRAPATLRQAQSTLATLQGAAVPLAPAADGLRATAPSLTAALVQVPRFANAAVPTLNEVAAVSPQLSRLGQQATPVVRALVPLTRQLTGYTRTALEPVATMLADKGGAANALGVAEGWARSTQGYDASSHIFRFGASIGLQSFAQLLAMAGVPGLPSPGQPGAPLPTGTSALNRSAGKGTAGGRAASAGRQGATPGRPGAGAGKPGAGGQPGGVAPQTPAGAAGQAAAGVQSASVEASSDLHSLLGYLLDQ